MTDQELVTGYVTDEVYIFGDPTASAGPVANGTTCPAGSEANFDGYDPVDHDIYVPNALSRSLSILSGACKVLATLTFPSKALPYAAAFDPINNQVYVTDQRMGQVYVLNGTTLVKTIHDADLDFPQGIVFDPGDAVMAVADLGAGTVLFLSGYAVSGSATVGGEPQLLTYDPYFGRLLITNIGGDNVTSLNALDPLGGGNINIPVGVDPVGIAFDYATSTDYVANEIGGNVTEIDGYGAQYGSIPVGSAPYGVTWDADKLSVYVANIDSGNISVIQGASVVRTITTPSGSGPTGIAYDEATDQVFVTSNGAVYVTIRPTYGRALYPTERRARANRVPRWAGMDAPGTTGSALSRRSSALIFPLGSSHPMTAVKVQLVYSGLRTRNLLRALRFYRKLGFRVHKRGTMGHGGRWVHLTFPGSEHRLELNFYPRATGSTPRSARGPSSTISASASRTWRHGSRSSAGRSSRSWPGSGRSTRTSSTPATPMGTGSSSSARCHRRAELHCGAARDRSLPGPGR